MPDHLTDCILPRAGDASCEQPREDYGLCPEHDGYCADHCPVTGGGVQVHQRLEGATGGGEAIERPRV
jgi:hypothetical protein